MRIGELAGRAGTSPRLLRYYESCGLITSQRSPSGQRHYTDDAVERVTLIRRLLAAGLGTVAIADVLPCLAEPSTRSVELTRRLVEERDRLEREISQRVAMRDALGEVIEVSPPLT